MEERTSSTGDKIKDLIMSLVLDSGYQSHFRNPKIYPITDENYREAETLIHNIYTGEIGRLKHGIMNLSREIEVLRDEYDEKLDEKDKIISDLKSNSSFFSNFKGYAGFAKGIMLLIISGGLCLALLFAILFGLSLINQDAANSAILGIEKMGASVAKIIEVSK